jgi:hypothetical protein
MIYIYRNAACLGRLTLASLLINITLVLQADHSHTNLVRSDFVPLRGEVYNWKDFAL